MWAPSVGLATVRAGTAGDRSALLAGPPARLFVVFEPTALRYRGAPARRPGEPVASVRRIPRGPGRPAGEAGSGPGQALAVLDLLDHAAAELAADQFHAGQVLRPATGPAGVIRPLLVGEPGGLRRRRWAGAAGLRLLTAGGGALGGTAALRHRARRAGAALRLGCGRRPGGRIRGRRGGGIVR